MGGAELRLLNRLGRAEAEATLNTLRMATGKKINFASDNPSGLVQLSGFETQLSVVRATMKNVTAATSTVSQSQLKLDQIRTQLDLIQANLLTDEDQDLTTNERLAKQAAIDTALDTINELAGSSIDGKRLLAGAAAYQTSGQNASQLRRVSIQNAGRPTQLTAGTQAELTYSGADGLAVDDSNITIEGKQGSLTIDVATTDSLAELAHRINVHSTATGVVAEAEGDTLKIRSTGARSSDFVRVTTNSGDNFAVSGGDVLNRAYGTDPTQATKPTISGSVLQAATQGVLVHDAGGAIIAADANFTITGRLGEATIDVAASENLSLADFATRINNQSHKTGVQATVQGTKISLTSIDYGSQSSVSVAINSGTFATKNEAGQTVTTDSGSDLVALINGRTRSGNSAATAATLVHHTDAGTLASNTTFTLRGASGTETFSVDVNVDDTLTGLRTAINAATGDTGVHAEIVDNDLVLTSTTTGSGAEIELRVVSGSFAVDGGNGDGTANGTNAVTNSSSVDGNRVTINENGLIATLEFAAGFTGTFDTVTVEGGGLDFNLFGDEARLSRLAFDSVQTYQLGGMSGTLEDLRTGGTAAGLGDKTSHALRIIGEALERFSRIQGAVDGFADAAITSAAAVSSAMEDNLIDSIDSINKVNDAEEQILLEKNQALASNALASISIMNQQRSQIVEIIKKIAGL